MSFYWVWGKNEEKRGKEKGKRKGEGGREIAREKNILKDDDASKVK